MTQYILEGEPKEVAKVIQENRIRVERGVITFTPVQPGRMPDSKTTATDSGTDSKEVNSYDSKDVPADDVKETTVTKTTSRRSKKSE